MTKNYIKANKHPQWGSQFGQKGMAETKEKIEKYRKTREYFSKLRGVVSSRMILQKFIKFWESFTNIFP